MEDTFQHKGLRKKLVETILEKGIKDSRILDAIGTIPRHVFMDSSFIQFSYKDQAFPIGAGQTISQPYTVAFQTELLEVKPRQRVLEIGTGSGYQTPLFPGCRRADQGGAHLRPAGPGGLHAWPE